jgi:hypothetical protein
VVWRMTGALGHDDFVGGRCSPGCEPHLCVGHTGACGRRPGARYTPGAGRMAGHGVTGGGPWAPRPSSPSPGPLVGVCRQPQAADTALGCFRASGSRGDGPRRDARATAGRAGRGERDLARAGPLVAHPRRQRPREPLGGFDGARVHPGERWEQAARSDPTRGRRPSPGSRPRARRCGSARACGGMRCPLSWLHRASRGHTGGRAGRGHGRSCGCASHAGRSTQPLQTQALLEASTPLARDTIAAVLAPHWPSGASPLV